MKKVTVHEDWKKRLIKDWSSRIIYVGLFLSGVEQILKEYGQAFLSPSTYAMTMSGLLIVTLAAKVLRQPVKTEEDEKGDSNDQSSS